MKFQINPTENFEYHITEILSKNYFSRHKYQLSYLAEFTKHVNGEEVVFHKWVKSDMNNNCFNENVHNMLLQNLDDEQLEGSGFQFQSINASSYIELPPKYKNSQSIINIKSDDHLCFLWCILACLFPVEDKKKNIKLFNAFYKIQPRKFRTPYEN